MPKKPTGTPRTDHGNGGAPPGGGSRARGGAGSGARPGSGSGEGPGSGAGAGSGEVGDAGGADQAAPEDGAPGRRASDRGRYGRLSRERVLETAVALVDREGLSALSMRRLGAELEVEAMALYRYAAGKDALLDGLVEAFYRELEEHLGPLEEAEGDENERVDGEGEDDRADGGTANDGEGDGGEGSHGGRSGTEATAGWREALHSVASETYAAAMRHPQIVPLLATRMLAVPLARRPLPVLRHQERVLALLARAGLPDLEAAAASRAVSAWLLGSLFTELQALDADPDEPEPAFRLGLHHMPARELPRLRATAPALAAPHDAESELKAGLDALLDRLVPAART